MKQEFTCVVCPNGCLLTVWEEKGQVKVEGAACKNGVTYGINELTDPRRVLTTSIRVTGGTLPLVSVRSDRAIKKSDLIPAMREIGFLTVPAPVKIGDLLYADEAMELRLLATRNVPKA